MFAFNFKPPMDPHKVTSEIPVISFKPKPKAKAVEETKPKKTKKVEESKKVEENKPVEKVEEAKPVVKAKPVEEAKPVVKVEETKPVEKVEEAKPKRTKLVPGSDEAKAWGIAMKARRDAKKALKTQEQTEESQ
jgi:hypothetical protein